MTKQPHDCRELRDRIVEQIKTKTLELNRTPVLHVIQVGDRADSNVYVKNKVLVGEKCGIKVTVHKLDQYSSEKEIECYIRRSNDNPNVDGVIVQLPLPDGLNEEYLLNCISSEKDVDGLNHYNRTAIHTNKQTFTPCTPQAVMTILDDMAIDLESKNVVIIGRSHLVGKPLATLLDRKNATVTLCHSKTKDLASHTRKTDIIISAVGKANLVTSPMINVGSILIDVGITKDKEGHLCGDIANTPGIAARSGAYTSVPGGVGLITVAMLMQNTLQSNITRRAYYGS